MNDAYVTAMSDSGEHLRRCSPFISYGSPKLTLSQRPKGRGSDARRKGVMRAAFQDETTFETLMRMFRRQFRTFIHGLQHELQVIATAHFEDIRGTLDIVRSEHVAEESERDPQFRDRVAKETGRLQDEMRRVKMTSIERGTPFGSRATTGPPSSVRMLSSPPRPLNPDGQETEGERSARLAFEADHPDGVVHLPTSGEGRRCAWEALIGSFAAKFPHLEPPRQLDLDRSFKRLARDHPNFGMSNRNMFRVDQMASSLFEWARGRHRLSVQLGCLVPHPQRKYFPVLVPLADGVEVDARLWVYNNDCRDDEWEGAHFEGLADASVQWETEREDLTV